MSAIQETRDSLIPSRPGEESAECLPIRTQNRVGVRLRRKGWHIKSIDDPFRLCECRLDRPSTGEKAAVWRPCLEPPASGLKLDNAIRTLPSPVGLSLRSYFNLTLLVVRHRGQQEGRLTSRTDGRLAKVRMTPLFLKAFGHRVTELTLLHHVITVGKLDGNLYQTRPYNFSFDLCEVFDWQLIPQ